MPPRTITVPGIIQLVYDSEDHKVIKHKLPQNSNSKATQNSKLYTPTNCTHQKFVWLAHLSLLF